MWLLIFGYKDNNKWAEIKKKTVFSFFFNDMNNFFPDIVDTFV